jgi:hypothetical protein
MMSTVAELFETYLMHYKIKGCITIKAENAAKPWCQKSRYTSNYILRLPMVRSSVDYGCGKLRYFDEIRARTKIAVFVDSKLQLSRTQIIRGKRTSVRAYLGAYRNSICQTVEEFKRDTLHYDRAFCINVLSTIPNLRVRTQVLRLIRRKLKRQGEAIFVVQYRNSDFTSVLKSGRGSKFLDGILIKSNGRWAFYAPIRPDKLRTFVERQGFKVVATDRNQGSIYLRCRV